MPYDQLSLFFDTNRKPRKPETSVVSEVKVSPPGVAAGKAAAASKVQATTANSPAGKRPKTSAKASAAGNVPSAAIELLTVQQVARLCTVSRATIWRWLKNLNGFPQPLRLAPGTTRWQRQEVQAWLDARPANLLEGGSQ